MDLARLIGRAARAATDRWNYELTPKKRAELSLADTREAYWLRTRVTWALLADAEETGGKLLAAADAVKDDLSLPEQAIFDESVRLAREALAAAAAGNTAMLESIMESGYPAPESFPTVIDGQVADHGGDEGTGQESAHPVVGMGPAESPATAAPPSTSDSQQDSTSGGGATSDT